MNQPPDQQDQQAPPPVAASEHAAPGIRCLVVEDNRALNRDLVFFLQMHGIAAQGVADGDAMTDCLKRQETDVIILDLGLPGEDGLSIARRLAAKPEIALVILTARDRLEDRLAGWESGACVYLVKPVPLEEIVAVVKSVYRRTHPATKETGPRVWGFCSLRRQLIAPDGTAIPLTHRERLLVDAMLEAPQQRIPRDLLLDQDAGGAIDALIHRLRRKLRAHGDPIRTIYGEGYVFEDPLRRI